jgi:hypothetical protein
VLLEPTEADVSVMASTSWRMSALHRYAGRLFRPTSRQRATAPIGKTLARRMFRRGMRRLLVKPGIRRGVQLVYRLAPGPVGWLALHYRAYERQPPVPLDLSDDEARLLRQFTTSRGAAVTTTT